MRTAYCIPLTGLLQSLPSVSPSGHDPEACGLGKSWQVSFIGDLGDHPVACADGSTQPMLTGLRTTGGV